MKDNEINKNKIEGIEDEFQDIALELSKVDFSENSNQKKVYSNLINNMEKSDNMKKSKLIRRCSAAAIIIAASGIFVSQNAYAKAAVQDFLNRVSLGSSITIFQENLEGKNPDDYKVLYDESGNEVSKEAIEKGGTFYSKNGEQISIQGKSEEKHLDKLVVTDVNKINDYTCFNVKVPSYLPEGYKFKQAEFYKDENGEVKDSKYVWLVLTNPETGKEFYIDERKDCEETRTVESTVGTVEKIEINGVDAALSNGRNVEWVKDDTIYSLMGRELNSKEAVKVAESIE